MRRDFTLLPLLVASAIVSSTALAQQSAGATFAAASSPSITPGKRGAATASADLPPASSPSAGISPAAAGDHCERTVPCIRQAASAKPKAVTAKAPAAPKFDRLAVHPQAAIKDTPAPEIALPGVMTITGANAHALDLTRARIIDVGNAGTQVVYLSNIDRNRIQLPWPNSRVIGTEELIVDKNATSNNVYIQFKPGAMRSVAVSFEQPDGPSVVDLKLEPKDIIGQVVLVRDSMTRAGEQKPLKGGDYVTATQSLMEQVALGAAPQGYSPVVLTIGPIAMNGLVVTPEKVYSSADRDLYVYDVANPGPQKASLAEKEFDGENVLAISIFPKHILAANEHTRVMVLTRKATGG